jgi:uncharacterized protein YerC
MATKTQALRKAATTQKALNKAEKAADDAAKARDTAVYAAQEAGATYPEIQEATGLSTARVTQVLRKVRQARATTTQED